jgi:hypothetical protein
VESIVYFGLAKTNIKGYEVDSPSTGKVNRIPYGQALLSWTRNTTSDFASSLEAKLD